MTTKLIVKKRGNLENDHLLVLHGWGMNSSVWKMIAKELEQHFYVIWVDLPGYGDNLTVKANNLAEIVTLILPLIAKSSHIMAWSLGGLIAQEIVRQQPQLIQRVVMIASTPRFSQSEQWSHAMPNKLLLAFSRGLLKDLQGTIKRFIALQFMQVKDSQHIQRALRQQILANMADKNALKVGLKILQQQDFTELKMKHPQLWLLGGKDRLIPIEIKNDLKLIYPNAMIKEIAEAGHAPFMTHPQPFLDIVIPFLMLKK